MTAAPLDDPAELLGQAGRGRVAAFLREARVAADVQEAHRGRMLETAVQAGIGQHHFEAFDDVAGPRARLLQVVHRDDRALGEGAQLIAEVDPEDLVGLLARLHGWSDDL